MTSNKKRDRWESDDEDDNKDNNVEKRITDVSSKTEVKNENENNDVLLESVGLNDNNDKNDNTLSAIIHHNPLLNGCRSVYNSYERLNKIDEGTYGIVWKARDLSTNEVVALKQIKYDNNLFREGFPITALREISVLLALNHECIVTVREMVVGDSFDKVFMVMELMEMDLHEAITTKINEPLQQSELKSILYQILSAMDHMHSKWFIHRDLKTSNILINKSGKVALCDFGLARKYQIPHRALTQLVITLWYRPPELLFGETVYGPEVDMWSFGCVFGELLTKEGMIQGQGELDQIDKIFRLLGVPTDETWPEFKSLPNAQIFSFSKQSDNELLDKFPINSFSCNQTYLDVNGFNLLQELLMLNPKKRLCAKDALSHDYFKKGVAMSKPKFQFD